MDGSIPTCPARSPGHESSQVVSRNLDLERFAAVDGDHGHAEAILADQAVLAFDVDLLEREGVMPANGRCIAKIENRTSAIVIARPEIIRT
jgi:hypothetical protein